MHDDFGDRDEDLIRAMATVYEQVKDGKPVTGIPAATPGYSETAFVAKLTAIRPHHMDAEPSATEVAQDDLIDRADNVVRLSNYTKKDNEDV